MKNIVREKRGICGICSAGCWIIAGYDERGAIVSVRADGEGSRMGIVCALGEHSPEIIYSKNRLLYPMRRKGAKGSHEFERITWDDAYDIIVEKLEAVKREHGPEAAAIYTGVGSFEQSLCDVFQPAGVAVSSASSVLFPFGSPNTMGVGALCYVSYGMIAPHLTMGRMLINMFNDMENSRMIFVWGTNPATDSPPVEMNRILEAKKRGARVVVIDPRRTAAAKLADAQWVPVRPGTDGALALGMCNVLIQEELYDERFAREWCAGFEDFSRYVQHFRPDLVEHITTVPAGTVVSLARELAATRGVSQLMYTGMEYSHTGVQGIRTAQVLWALAGQLDVPGGLCFTMPSGRFPINRDGLIRNPVENPRLGRDKFPLYVKYRDEAHAIALPESVLNGNPYRIRTLIILGGSIITSWPNPALWKKTLGGLEFLVCIDRQLTADAAYADIVLPASTYYENESYMTYGPMFRIRERMIEPVGESRNDFFILAELARRLGYGHLYPQTHGELLRYVLKGSGFTPEQVREAGGAVSIEAEMMQYRKWEKGLLRQDGMPGFDTPTGKFEIASTILAEYGYDPLPVYTEPREGPLSRPDLAESYPLVFNSGARMRTSFHTQHHGIPGLNRKRPEPAVHINTGDAGARGIEDGDMVRIRTMRGEVGMRAMVTHDIAPGFIDANHACGGPVGPRAWRECNVNELTDMEQYDPISGFPVYKSLLCEVMKDSDTKDRVVMHAGEKAVEYAVADGPRSAPVYLDHNATTPLSREARDAMSGAMEFYGNPSSIYDAGRKSRALVEEARRRVAESLNCTARRIVFTGSGSESDNLAVKGAALAAGNGKNHIITSDIEHPAVRNACAWLAGRGYEVTFLPVDAHGIVDPSDLESAINDRTALVSIMLANNETGSIQPIGELASVAKKRSVLFHSDCTQAMGRIPVDAQELGADLITISGHKFHGPKGVGALYCRRDVPLTSLISGGRHEWGMRAGTENVISIAGFGAAALMVPRLLSFMHAVRLLRDRLDEGIRALVAGARLNGHPQNRLPNTLNMTLPGYRGESMVIAMDRHRVYFSSGSACQSGSPEPSHALLAMGLTESDAHCSLRFSLGYENTEEEIDRVTELMTRTIRESKSTIHFVPCR
jgi:cysteine sulfinate desulfinase/cysteine desulfurase-like protein/anaerobic selenocysteine-containing dehydrogenase